mmetsp:Transcript_105568/g.182014  ORF Transcript_105568/g.182014 Transcript_105568/m.182014 type:complete len:214 (+) Transcript_105568:677-1318(+)
MGGVTPSMQGVVPHICTCTRHGGIRLDGDRRSKRLELQVTFNGPDGILVKLVLQLKGGQLVDLGAPSHEAVLVILVAPALAIGVGGAAATLHLWLGDLGSILSDLLPLLGGLVLLRVRGGEDGLGCRGARGLVDEPHSLRVLPDLGPRLLLPPLLLGLHIAQLAGVLLRLVDLAVVLQRVGGVPRGASVLRRQHGHVVVHRLRPTARNPRGHS